MIYEFALEPDLVSRWHDRKEYLFFDEKFGIRARRVISGYPKNWKKLVWHAFSESPASRNQNSRMRMTEIIQLLWQNAVRRYSTFTKLSDWLERAEAEHRERPFHAIIALKNPRNRSFIITVQRLIENGHDLWNISETYPTARTAEEIAGAVSPITRLCRHAILIDPYFDPTKFIVKLTPMHKTKTALDNDVRTCGDYTMYYPYEKHEENLRLAGYDVLVFVASREEDEGRITRGNAILSGTKPFVM